MLKNTDNDFIPEVRSVLRGIFLWPGDGIDNKGLLFLSWFACFFPLYLLIPQIIFLIYGAENMMELIENGCPVAEILLTIIKMILCNFKRENIRKIIINLEKEFNEHLKLKEIEINKILLNTKNLCRFITIWYSIWFSFICINWAFLPIGKYYYFYLFNTNINYTMTLPYKTIYIYDTENNIIFTITYILIIYIVYLLALALSGYDILFVSLAYHLTAEFKILNYKIININNIINNNNSSDLVLRNNNNNEKIYQTLRDLIVQHIKCIRFMDDLEEAFNIFLMIQFLSSSIIVCIVAFQMTLTLGINFGTFQIIGYLLGSLLQLFIFCFTADKLMREAANVSAAAYNIKWYLCDLKMQKSLLLLLLRGQRPMGITAAKFYIINLSSFQTILSTSYSYFALLQTVSN